MANMIYTSKKGRQIVFDDFEDSTEEYGTYWGNMCPHCHNKFKGILGNRASDGGSGEATCSVKGCENNAGYYVDFNVDEVTFTE